NNPKIFIGFSDATNNHWLLNQLGLVTYYGLNFLSDLCELETQMLSYTKENYELFFQNEPKIEIKPSPTWFENRTSYGDDQLGVPLNAHGEKRGYEVLYGKGVVSGKLWGGCLESIYDIYTSNRYPDQRKIYDDFDLIPQGSFFKEKIIFLETSEERPEPELFEKMMNLLIKENVLTQSSALIVGKPYDEVHYEAYKKILIKIAGKLKLPTLYNVNVGHALPRAMLPIGLNGQIDLNNKKIFITESLFSA
ncbi:MAG TPA: LD-carboxypeptidase, partial [Acholeplasmataceae bacterium]|nr:LD-carboxypeptidase [Acholeplasmataceae bacterium]